MKKLLVAMLVSLMVLLGIASADIVGDFTVTGGVNGVDYTFDATTKLLTVTTGTELTISTSKNHKPWYRSGSRCRKRNQY